ncbi:MAG: dephospho-CoA kinase [Erysipelotrichales bacterium]|nr:dephospho-CoA kinase [Erysipelotrichales bacterium]
MKVAVTGSIGSGKSTVCGFLKRAGYPVISADEVNGELLHNEDVKKDIVDLLELEKFSREAISCAIFEDNSKRKKLNDYLHPKILEKVLAFLEQNKGGLVFAEIPLLYEAGWDKYFDASVAVITDPKIAEERLLKERHISVAESRKRRLKQLAQEEKARRSDYQILNNGDISHLVNQIEVLINLLSERENEYTI